MYALLFDKCLWDFLLLIHAPRLHQSYQNKKAEFQVRSGLILEKLATNFNIAVEDDDLEAKFEEIALSSGTSLENIKQFYKGNEKLKSGLFYGLREEKVFGKHPNDLFQADRH